MKEISTTMFTVSRTVGSYFRSVNTTGKIASKYGPLDIPFCRDETGHPAVQTRFDAGILYRAQLFPVIDCHDNRYMTCTYMVDGLPVMFFGRDDMVLPEYPRNVFLNVCIHYGRTVEITDFCVDLLGKISMVNYGIAEIPGNVFLNEVKGRDCFAFNRSDMSLFVSLPQREYKKLYDRKYLADGLPGCMKLTLEHGKIARSVIRNNEETMNPKYVPHLKDTAEDIRRKMTDTLSNIVKRNSPSPILTFSGKGR